MIIVICSISQYHCISNQINAVLRDFFQKRSQIGSSRIGLGLNVHPLKKALPQTYDKRNDFDFTAPKLTVLNNAFIFESVLTKVPTTLFAFNPSFNPCFAPLCMYCITVNI